ncbi:hypothetical protein FK216_03405 [Moraxellaceae bacterium AER2_44_116]|nr:hypothetical protein [Moraxellaceae bacterium]TQC99293.1 hypothetical protein FK216_03405 [Moraxellaceae bacterium AER2_44_116]
MKEVEKGTMLGSGQHEFFVVNLTRSALTGSVVWSNNSSEYSIDVNGLQPGSVSVKQAFAPASGHKDYWKWTEKGRDYQLNCYDDDRYAVVTISEYGIGVLVTSTSPDTWKW